MNSPTIFFKLSPFPGGVSSGKSGSKSEKQSNYALRQHLLPTNLQSAAKTAVLTTPTGSDKARFPGS